jgi:hypothetical protein
MLIKKCKLLDKRKLVVGIVPMVLFGLLQPAIAGVIQTRLTVSPGSVLFTCAQQGNTLFATLSWTITGIPRRPRNRSNEVEAYRFFLYGFNALFPPSVNLPEVGPTYNTARVPITPSQLSALNQVDLAFTKFGRNILYTRTGNQQSYVSFTNTSNISLIPPETPITCFMAEPDVCPANRASASSASGTCPPPGGGS